MSPRLNCNNIYKMHQILKIQNMFKLEICSFEFKFFHNKLPKCFEGLFKLNISVHGESMTFQMIFIRLLLKKTICRHSILHTDKDTGIKSQLMRSQKNEKHVPSKH